MTKQIPLSNGCVAIVDEEDYRRLARHRWHATVTAGGAVYARRGECRNGRDVSVSMAREIMSAPKGSMVDHINGDTLDNRRSNLRICSERENAMNRRVRSDSSTGLKGVRKVGNRFGAAIYADKRYYYLGVFDTAEEAARAHDAKARELHGEFARLNFPDPRSLPPPPAPLDPPAPRGPRPTSERFEAYVERCAISGCWLWSGSHNRDGYGSIWINGRAVSAHQLSYELHKGPVTPGLVMHRRCGVTACVNPDHLYLGTRAGHPRRKKLAV